MSRECHTCGALVRGERCDCAAPARPIDTSAEAKADTSLRLQVFVNGDWEPMKGYVAGPILPRHSGPNASCYGALPTANINGERMAVIWRTEYVPEPKKPTWWQCLRQGLRRIGERMTKPKITIEIPSSFDEFTTLSPAVRQKVGEAVQRFASDMGIEDLFDWNIAADLGFTPTDYDVTSGAILQVPMLRNEYHGGMKVCVSTGGYHRAEPVTQPSDDSVLDYFVDDAAVKGEGEQ